MDPTNRPVRLTLRLTAGDKQTLTAAAAAERRSVSQFVVDAAMVRAEDALPLRQTFALDANRWTAFVEALDAQPHDLPNVQTLFAEPAPFDEQRTCRGGRQA